MSLFAVFLVAIALSIDAWAVSLTCGMKLGKVRWDKYFKIALAFGTFQALMPMIGWFIGMGVASLVERWASFVTAAVFAGLAVKTFLEARKVAESDIDACSCANTKCLMTLAVATSIDALIVGGVFAISKVSIVVAVVVIGTVTFLGTFAALLGGRLGSRLFGRAGGYLATALLTFLACRSFLAGWQEFFYKI